MKERKEEHKAEHKEKHEVKKPTNFLEKLFGGLKITWPRLILASVIIGVFVGILMTIQPLVDTSFTRIGVIFYWWVLFGTIIITNSKSELDSALKCFIFFLISQPLIYFTQILIHFAQNPAAGFDWSLFGFYRYWFIWTLATIPMGFVGYWLIKRRNAWSIIALAPAIMLVALEALGEFNTAIHHFPQYLLSGIICVVIIAMLLLGILKEWKLRAALVTAAIVLAAIVILTNQAKPEDYHFNLMWDVKEYGVTPEQEWHAESEFGDRAALELYDIIGEDEKPTGEKEYNMTFRGDGYDFGKHDVKLVSPTETKNCILEIEKDHNSFACE